MTIFAHLSKYDYGEVHLRRDEATGLNAIVAIHDTRLGPSLGGCRFIHYESDEAALIDALRLARGMSYKAAITGLPHGGGKSVIIRPKGEFDRVALFKAFGSFVEDLGGRYITAEDSGTGLDDMEAIRSVTAHVTGIKPESGGGGDPSPFTALGVRRGIEAAVKHTFERDDLDGIHVAVQGVGNVGYSLCRELSALGARLTVTDVDPGRVDRAVKEFGATAVALDAITSVECEVFAPCALGAVIDDQSLPGLRCKIIAGAANNVLAEERHGVALMERGIVYAPDYAINAGGLVNVAEEHRAIRSGEAYDEARSRSRTMEIYDTILEILVRADREKRPSYAVADAIAEERLEAAGT